MSVEQNQPQGAERTMTIQESVETLLQEDLPKATPQDPDGYTRRADALGKNYLWREINFGLAQHIYEVAVRFAEGKNDTAGKQVHRGLLYANLAVSKIAQGNIDGAAPDLFDAYAEDKRTYDKDADTSKNVTDADPWVSPVFSQILKAYLFDNTYAYLQSLITPLTGTPLTSTPIPAPADLLKQLGVERTVTLMLDVMKFQARHAEVSRSNNSYSRACILNILRQVAVLIESDLQRHGAPSGTLSAKLPHLFNNTAATPNWWPDFWNNYRVNDVQAKTDSPISIEDQIQNAETKDPTVGNQDQKDFQKSLVTFYAVRNYSAHQTEWNTNLTASQAQRVLGRLFHVFLAVPKVKKQ